MEKDGEMNLLVSKIVNKTKEESRRAEKLFEEELSNLSKKLVILSRNEFSTIEDAINREVLAARKRIDKQSNILSIAFGWEWLRLVLMTIAIFIGMGVIYWSVTSGLDIYTAQQISQMESNKTEISLQQATLRHLEKKTFGIILSEDKKGKFIVLPKGTKIQTGWTMGAKDAIKLE